MHSAVEVSSRETLSQNDTQSFCSAEYHFGIDFTIRYFYLIFNKIASLPEKQLNTVII